MWLRVIWAASILSLSAVAVQAQSQRAPDAAKAVAQQLFGDWAYRCARANGTNAKTCELAQSVRFKRGGKLLEVIFGSEQSALKSLATAMLSAGLTAGLPTDVSARLAVAC